MFCSKRDARCMSFYLVMHAVSLHLYVELFFVLHLVGLTLRCSRLTAGTEAMGCTSAKQLSAVPNEDEGQSKAYSNGDAFSGQLSNFNNCLFDMSPCKQINVFL